MRYLSASGEVPKRGPNMHVSRRPGDTAARNMHLERISVSVVLLTAS